MNTATLAPLTRIRATLDRFAGPQSGLCSLILLIVRAYLTGVSSTSILTAYRKGERVFCGNVLAEGLEEHGPLPQPILTPTTKAPIGEHDENVSRDEIIARNLVSAELFDAAATYALRLFEHGQKVCAERGLILVDTKYEFGVTKDGQLVVIDEIHTPDSSRFWFAESYEARRHSGQSPESFDKEYLRLWLGDQGYKGAGPRPEIPVDVRCEATRRYIEAFEQITGCAFEPDTQPIEERIRRNLGID